MWILRQFPPGGLVERFNFGRNDQVTVLALMFRDWWSISEKYLYVFLNEYGSCAPKSWRMFVNDTYQTAHWKERARKQLSALKWGMIDTLGVSPFVRMIQALPAVQAVRILESIRLTGTVDYARKQIQMQLHSVAELSRLRSCAKEPETVTWLEEHLRPGEVFYDIGANVGAYSLVAFAITQSDCTIYAFEPSYSTFSALCNNLRINGCAEHVLPLNIALSNQTQILPFNYSTVRAGAALHSVGEPIDFRGERFVPEFVQPVLSFKLDDFIDRFCLKQPHLIKIDVDGAEAEIVKGASKTLANKQLRSILVELRLDSPSANEITSSLEQLGFRLRAWNKSVTDGLANGEFVR